MPRYLISFDDGDMDHISEEDLPMVDTETHAVVRQAKAAGIWIFGGGMARQPAKRVEKDGSVQEGPWPETKATLGGFAILDVSTHEEAIIWATRFAKACRCTQEVREIMFDPES
jgi:hypothetical protein